MVNYWILKKKNKKSDTKLLIFNDGGHTFEFVFLNVYERRITLNIVLWVISHCLHFITVRINSALEQCENTSYEKQMV